MKLYRVVTHLYGVEPSTHFVRADEVETTHSSASFFVGGELVAHFNNVLSVHLDA